MINKQQKFLLKNVVHPESSKTRQTVYYFSVKNLSLIYGIKSILNAASIVNLFNNLVPQTFAKMVAVEKF